MKVPYSLLLFVSSVLASSSLARSDGLPIAGGVTLSTGYRSDDTAWSIAADGGPNPISELQWTDLQIAEIKLEGEFTFDLPILRRGFVFLPEIGYGRILSGQNQDSDYAFSGRRGEFSRSVADTDGYVFDASMGIGFQFAVPKTRLQLRPSVGYSFHKQSMKDTNGRQLVDRPGLEAALDGELPEDGASPDLGAFSGLASTYANEWYGPWVGLDAEFPLSPNVRLEVGGRYHWVDLQGDAYWNLRDLNFENQASGHGISAHAALVWAFRENVGLKLSGHWSSFETGRGSQSDPDGPIPLNEVTWESWGVRLGATIRF